MTVFEDVGTVEVCATIGATVQTDLVFVLATSDGTGEYFQRIFIPTSTIFFLYVKKSIFIHLRPRIYTIKISDPLTKEPYQSKC